MRFVLLTPMKWQVLRSSVCACCFWTPPAHSWGRLICRTHAWSCCWFELCALEVPAEKIGLLWWVWKPAVTRELFPTLQRYLGTISSSLQKVPLSAGHSACSYWVALTFSPFHLLSSGVICKALWDTCLPLHQTTAAVCALVLLCRGFWWCWWPKTRFLKEHWGHEIY